MSVVGPDGFQLDPAGEVPAQVVDLARGRLDDALARLDGLAGADAAQIEDAVHEVRKRCKEARGLARLVRPPLGKEFGRFDRLVRDAANELSSLRDAHAVLETFEHLQAASAHAGRLDPVRARQAEIAADATRSVRSGDPRIATAAHELSRARERIDRWDVPDGFGALAPGLGRTYRRGRRGLDDARRRTGDESMHEWRKAVKYLLYQVRLLMPAAPSVLEPLAGRLDELSDALGDDHDLAVLIARLEAEPDRYGGPDEVAAAIALARASQADLRTRAFRLGATLYAESPSAFVARVGAYWKRARRLGPELPTGSLERLAAAADRCGIERERRFLVDELPAFPDEGVELRQGYLAIDRDVSARLRSEPHAPSTLTVEAGAGSVRTELEWPIADDRFDELWPLTEGRRIRKTRFRLHTAERVVAVDVFHDDLDGLVIAEVEFHSDQAMEGFLPPDWFGAEVTDDPRYSNASLAAFGLDASAGRSNVQTT